MSSTTRHERDEQGTGQGQAERLHTLASEIACFKTPGGELFARLPVSGHYEVRPLDGPMLRRWLVYRYETTYGAFPDKNAVANVVDGLASRAEFNGQVAEVSVRVAGAVEGGAGAITLDLADAEWRAVTLTRGGWDVVAQPETRFRRPKGMEALPEPVRPADGETVETLLRPFLNSRLTDAQWKLLVGWLLMTLHPAGPYPVLVLHGGQGTGKSSLTEFLRLLVDPAEALIHVQPKDAEALRLKAYNGWMVPLDNLSKLPPWLSDRLCTLSSGASDAARKLYTNDEELAFRACRPVIINGIEELATRGDLLDRSLVVTLEAIPDDARCDLDTLRADFLAARPRILGALLDAVSTALRHLPDAPATHLPRLAGFARWVEAAAPALGWEPGAFLAAYHANRQESTGMEVEASPVASAVVGFVTVNPAWEGTAGDLLDELRDGGYVSEAIVRGPYWPKEPQHLSNQLRRVAAALDRQGVTVEFLPRREHGTVRPIRLSMTQTAAAVGDAPGDAHSGTGDAPGDAPVVTPARGRGSAVRPEFMGAHAQKRRQANAGVTTGDDEIPPSPLFTLGEERERAGERREVPKSPSPSVTRHPAGADAPQAAARAGGRQRRAVRPTQRRWLRAQGFSDADIDQMDTDEASDRILATCEAA